MDKFLTICLHQVVGILYSVAEIASIGILMVSAVLTTVGLVRFSIFLVRAVVSTSGLVNSLNLVTEDIELPVDGGMREHTAVYRDDSTISAFTLGWFKPRIYLSTGLINKFDKDALDIVLCHEQGHVDRRDPLKSVIAGAVSELFWYVPLVKSGVERLRLKAEVACDGYAVAVGHDPMVVAKTLLNVAEAVPSRATVLAFGAVKSQLEVRVRALLGENILGSIRIPVGVVLASILIVGMILMASMAVISAQVDPGGSFSVIQSTIGSCDEGHGEGDLLIRLGIECPHCGPDTYEDPVTGPPTCHSS